MAITIEDITSNLKPIITFSPLKRDGELVINLETGFVYVEFFKRLFQDAKSMSASDLHEVDKDKNLGFSKFIDEWKQNGYID